MKKNSQQLGAVMVAGLFLAVLSGCQKEGPAETAGKKLDAAVGNTSDAIGDATEKAGDKLEDAGDSIKDATRSDGK